MKLGTSVADRARGARERTRPSLLLSICLLFASAGFAQTSVDPNHAMAPRQLQRAMMLKAEQIQAAPKTALRAATSSTPAPEKQERMRVDGRAMKGLQKLEPSLWKE